MKPLDDRLFLPAGLTARVLGISPQALGKWPISPAKENGRERLYFLPDVFSVATSRLDSPDLTAERTRLVKSQADISELDLAVKRSELIPADIVESHWTHFAANCRARLLNLPSRLGAVAGGMDIGQATKYAKELIYEALDELSQMQASDYVEPDPEQESES